MTSCTISRRQLLIGAGTALAAVGLASACSPITSPAASGPSLASTSIPPGQARKPAIVTVGQLAAILNAAVYPGTPTNANSNPAMFNPLVTLDDRRQPVGVLAESWTLADDRLTLTLKLRQGVTFHSGRPFTAEAAKWNIEYVLDPKTGAQPGAELQGVQARAVDTSTLELKLPDVTPHVFSLLTQVLMVDPQSDINSNPAGTGPFKFVDLKPGDQMQLERNPTYWRRDRPLLDQVTIRALPDPSSALVNLQAGAVDLVQCRASDVQSLNSASGTTTLIVPASGSYDLLFDTSAPPFTDKRVRQAIDLALDRKRFAESVMFGVTQPTYIMWPRTSPVWDEAIDVGEFNLDKAHQLLVDAGQGGGFDTKIQASSAYPETVQFDQIVQADLAKIGINASIEQLDSNQASALHSQGKFSPMLSLQFANGSADPARLFTAFPFRTVGNTTRFQSDEYTRMVEAARREPDWDKRVALYRQIALFVKDEAFALSIANYKIPYGVRSNLHGVDVVATTPNLTLENAYLA